MSRNLTPAVNKKSRGEGSGRRKRGIDWFDDDIVRDCDKQYPQPRTQDEENRPITQNTESQRVSGQTGSSSRRQTVVKVGKLLKPLTEIMPALVGDVGPLDVAGYTPARKYSVVSAPNVSQNCRLGDSGPMAVRFIELRAQGLPLDRITNETIEEVRLAYAMESYKEFVELIA